MASRQGRIALQLTQWVGGTIIILMFIFVIADYWMQHRFLTHSLESYARRDAEGVRSLLEAGRPFDEVKSKLETHDVIESYMGGEEHAVAIFDRAGNVLYKSSNALPIDPAVVAQLSQPPLSQVELHHLKVGGVPVVAAVTTFQTKEETPVMGYIACLRNAAEIQQAGLLAWGLRSLMVLVMIVGVMLAVRIPVKRFVVAPIDGLFMAAYAASRDDYQRMPVCPVDNEFSELYDMFGRLMGHLSDTRTQDKQADAQDEDAMAGEPVERREAEPTEPADTQPAE